MIDLDNKHHCEVRSLSSTIDGELCRLCVTDSLDELDSMYNYLRNNLESLYLLRRLYLYASADHFGGK